MLVIHVINDASRTKICGEEPKSKTACMSISLTIYCLGFCHRGYSCQLAK